MSNQEENLVNFTNYIEYVTNNYINMYDPNDPEYPGFTQITIRLPEMFITYANNTLTNRDIENFTSEQIQRQTTIISLVINLFQTLLRDEHDIFTDDEKNRFRDILNLYNEKKHELDSRLNPNPRTGGKKYIKNRKSRKGKKSRKNRKNRKSKKRV